MSGLIQVDQRGICTLIINYGVAPRHVEFIGKQLDTSSRERYIKILNQLKKIDKCHRKNQNEMRSIMINKTKQRIEKREKNLIMDATKAHFACSSNLNPRLLKAGTQKLKLLHQAAFQRATPFKLDYTVKVLEEKEVLDHQKMIKLFKQLLFRFKHDERSFSYTWADIIYIWGKHFSNYKEISTRTLSQEAFQGISKKILENAPPLPFHLPSEHFSLSFTQFQVFLIFRVQMYLSLSCREKCCEKCKELQFSDKMMQEIKSGKYDQLRQEKVFFFTLFSSKTDSFFSLVKGFQYCANKYPHKMISHLFEYCLFRFEEDKDEDQYEIERDIIKKKERINILSSFPQFLRLVDEVGGIIEKPYDKWVVLKSLLQLNGAQEAIDVVNRLKNLKEKLKNQFDFPITQEELLKFIHQSSLNELYGKHIDLLLERGHDLFAFCKKGFSEGLFSFLIQPPLYIKKEKEFLEWMKKKKIEETALPDSIFQAVAAYRHSDSSRKIVWDLLDIFFSKTKEPIKLESVLNYVTDFCYFSISDKLNCFHVEVDLDVLTLLDKLCVKYNIKLKENKESFLSFCKILMKIAPIKPISISKIKEKESFLDEFLPLKNVRALREMEIVEFLGEGSEGIVVLVRGKKNKFYVLKLHKENKLIEAIDEKKINGEKFLFNASQNSHVPEIKTLIVKDENNQIKGISSFHRNLNKFNVIGIVYEQKEKKISLRDLFNIGGKFPLSLVQFFGKQIIRAMRYLNENLKLVHCDLKLDNIVVDLKELKLTLIDFGTLIPEGSQVESRRGSLAFISPEALGLDFESQSIKKSIRLTRKSDIYSFGIVLWILAFGKPPLEYSHSAHFIRYFQNHLDFSTQLPEVCDPTLKDLLLKLTKMNPEKRPEIGSVIDHPFFKLVT